jgi:hypothetical protein
MTEAEWLACADLGLLLRFLKEKASDRKLRLFAAACCRRIPCLSELDPFRSAIEILELHADGLAAPELLNQVRQQFHADAQSEERKWLHATDRKTPACCTAYCEANRAYTLAYAAKPSLRDDVNLDMMTNYSTQTVLGELTGHKPYVSMPLDDWFGLVQGDHSRLAELAREIFGNPFRPVKFAAAWRTDIVEAVAHRIYESRDFSAMPILADALQDADCDSAVILDHCRSSGPHVRGCFVVDLLLARE